MKETFNKEQEDRHYGQLINGHEFQLKQAAFVGAIIRYCWYLGKRNFDELYHPKETFRNSRLVTIVIVALFIVFGFLIYFFS